LQKTEPNDCQTTLCQNKDVTLQKGGVATSVVAAANTTDQPKQAVEGGPVRVLIRKEDVKFEVQAKRKKASDYFNLYSNHD